MENLPQLECVLLYMWYALPNASSISVHTVTVKLLFSCL